jgi:hypothetical protein
LSAVLVPRGTVFALQSHEIERNWDHIAPHLERVAAKFPFDVDPAQVREDLKRALRQLWGYHDGENVTVICVTEIQHPVCWLRICAGTETSPHQIDAGIAEIESWARSIGCTRIRLAGRRGWKRRLSGYRQIAVTLEKLL